MNNPTVSEQLQGFPVFQMCIIMLLRLAEPIAFSSFLSYIFFMIKSFRITKNDAEVSKYSGYLASAFSLSQFFSSVPWGKASDKWGRKPAILIGCLGTALSMVLFGFSCNFFMAFVSRILMGLLNGNVPIMRTTVGEIAVEKRHQGIAFSNLSLIWGLGKCIGAYLAGHLTDVDHFREYRREEQNTNSLFVKFPFAFTNIVIALLIFNVVIIGWLFLEETHDDLRTKRDRGLEVGDKIRKLLGFEVPDRPWQTKKGESAETLIDNNSIDSLEDNDFEMQSFSSNEYIPIKVETEPSIFTWPIIHRIACNFFISFTNIIYTEFFPIFLAKTMMPKSLKFPFHMRGGFGYSTDATGKLLSTTGLIGVITVSILFPIINKHFSLLTGFKIGLAIIPLLFFALPLNLFTIPEYNHLTSSHALTTTLLYINAGFLSFFGSINNSQMVLLIHRASPKKQRALINGYTISITALSRFIAPLIWGWVMSKFDFSGTGGISWWLLAGVSVFVFGLSFILNEDDEHD